MVRAITPLGDVSSACFRDGGIIGGMTSTTHDKQVKLFSLIAKAAFLLAAGDQMEATHRKVWSLKSF